MCIRDRWHADGQRGVIEHGFRKHARIAAGLLQTPFGDAPDGRCLLYTSSMKPTINSVWRPERRWLRWRLPRLIRSRSSGVLQLRKHWTPVVLLWALGCSFAGAQPLPPTYIPQTKFARGQDVVPSFDGWLRNSDGSFTMVFGYLNRNYEEELATPAGADNQVSPGACLLYTSRCV